MTHKSSHIIIQIADGELDKLPADKKEKIEAILEEANKEVDKVLERNPNL
jgi:uncharacterized protein YjbJ (UPF0337 family)